jgi:ABC-type lipoprotein release transport system permease subunit
VGAVGFLVRCDLRRRWRSLLALALLVGVVGGVVLAALAGARRTERAYPRLLDALAAHDASVEVSPAYFDEVAGLPEVEVAAPASFVFVRPLGFESDDLLSLAATDERFNNVVDRPRLLDGRRPVPGRADEVLVNQETADRLGIGVGSVLPLASLTPRQMDRLVGGEDPGEPAGPEIEVTVVGVGRTEEELASGTPIVLFTPAFYARHHDDIGHFDEILQVRLTRGERDLAAFERGLRRVVPESEGAIVETHAETKGEIEDATGVQATSLVMFALVVALAGFVAIGQALARQIALAADEQPVLHALGLGRWQRGVALLLPAVVVAVIGAMVAAGLAVLASSLLPTGFARRVEPDPGLAADWLVLGVGCVAVAILVSARVALSAWSTTGHLQEAPAPASPGRVVARLARLGAPPSVLTGIRMALEPGRGRTAVPVRSAIAGAVTGVAGLVAALSFGAALGWAVTEPEAYGLTWDASVIGPSEPEGIAREASALAESDGVQAAAALSVLPIRLEGVPLQSYGVQPYKGAGFVTVLDGRAPQGTDEILVGSATLDRLGRQVGDTLVANGLAGGTPRELRIVGRGVFPEFVHPAVPDSDTGAYNDFALLTGAGNESLAAGAGDEYFSLALLRWAPGIDASAATHRIETDGAALQPAVRPKRFANLARVDAMPEVVAAFLVLVATAACGHALATSVRRRARDLAVLKTLGFVGSQVRAAVAWQATTLAAVGVALGVPIGLVIGRSVWAVLARRLGIDDHIPVPWLAVALTVPASFAVSILLAALPGRRAARIRPAVALRSE